MKSRILSWVLITVIMTLLCFSCFAQMTILKPEKVTFSDGKAFWCKKYLAKIPTNNWLIWLHGAGEIGATDGSQIDKVELYNIDATTGKKTPVTWTAQARDGFEFPFNIIAIQMTPGFDFWAIQKTASIYVKEVLKASEIGITGYSLGGRGAWYCVEGDEKHYINFIAPICGFYDFSRTPMGNLETIPGFGVHGDQDKVMLYQNDVQTAQLYNPGRPSQVINGNVVPMYYLLTIPGAGHNVWQIAYDVTPGKDFLLQWVIQQFGPQNTMVEPIVSSFFDGTYVIQVTQSGRKIITKPAGIGQ